MLPHLNNRSEASIEYKHQNISAVLLKYKMPYIVGYKPRLNYQALLEERVVDFLMSDKGLIGLFDVFTSEGVIREPRKVDFSTLLVEAPKNMIIKEPNVEYEVKLKTPNYIEIEQNNRKLGELGEELVIEYERWRLIDIGRESYAEQVEWVSKDLGDGAGFDVLSKNKDGSDRYIEVKTTKLGELTPFYFSKNELKFSRKKSTRYFLYRVFRFNQHPNVFIKNGSFDEVCTYEPVSFIGIIR